MDAGGLARVCDLSLERIASDALSITVAFEQRKRGVETKLLLGQTPTQADPILIRNVAIARSLYRELKNGSSFADLAKRNQISIPQVHRLMSFAFLSPATVEAICTGQQPASMSTQSLREIKIPSDWNEQKVLFELS